MTDTVGVFKLIDLIYDAALQPELWNDFLAAFTRATGCDGVGMHFQDRNTDLQTVSASFQFDRGQVRRYEQYYGSRNAWVQSAPALGPGETRASHEILADAELVKTEFYNDWLRPQNLFYAFGGGITREGLVPAQVTAMRNKQAGPFTPADLDLLRILIPHLTRAFQMYRQFGLVEFQRAASVDALDRVQVGVLFLSSTGKIVHLNRAAKAMVDQNDGLSIFNSELITAQSSETAALRRSLAEALAVYEDVDFELSSEPLLISRPSGKRSFLLSIVPSRREERRIRLMAGPEAPAVTVLLNDPESDDPADPKLFSHALGLTRAEANLATLLMKGMSVEECATELGISILTARNHLKKSLSKTGTKRQGELIRLLLKTALPFRP